MLSSWDIALVVVLLRVWVSPLAEEYGMNAVLTIMIALLVVEQAVSREAFLTDSDVLLPTQEVN